MPPRNSIVAEQCRASQALYVLSEHVYKLATNQPHGELVDLHPVERQRYLNLLEAAILTAREWQL